MADADPGIAGYLRLSRDEEREKGVSLSEKISLRKAILQTIARHNGAELPAEQITVELMSGGSLSERAGLLAILDRCRRRELHTVVAFDVDRLTRDVADLKTITQAMFRGEVTLITQRGVYQFDRHFDTTLLQILAVLGEKERRSFSYRRKATNEQRARSGQLSQGYAPYGYTWDADSKCYRVRYEEYAVLEELFRRLWTEGANAIAADLTRRRITAPGIGKRDGASDRWKRGTVHNIGTNPFYTGRLVKRHDVDRDGVTVDLPRSLWIWSDEPLSTIGEDGERIPLPHPIERDRWEELQEVRSGRRIGQPSRGLLTGLLHCSAGRPMARKLAFYVCECRRAGRGHPGVHVMREAVERLVWQAAADVLTPIAAKPLPKRQVEAAEATAARLELERRTAQRELREKEETLQDLVARSSYYRRLPHFGTADKGERSRYDLTLETLAADCEKLTKRIDALAEKLEGVGARKASPLLAEFVRIGGTVEMIRKAPVELQRALLRLVVRSIHLEPPPGGRGMTRQVRIELYPLVPGLVTTVVLPIVNPRQGVKRGPYKRREA